MSLRSCGLLALYIFVGVALLPVTITDVLLTGSAVGAGELADEIAAATLDPNKLFHIFRNEGHNLD
jgi:hypothetical protein